MRSLVVAPEQQRHHSLVSEDKLPSCGVGCDDDGTCFSCNLNSEGGVLQRFLLVSVLHQQLRQFAQQSEL